MKKLYLIAIAIAALMIASPIVSCISGFDSESDNDAPIALNTEIMSERIINLNLVDSSSLSKTIADVSTDSVLMMDSSTLSEVVSADTQVMKNAISNGTPIIVTGNPQLLQTIGMTVAINPNATVSAVYYDPISKTTYCYGSVSSETDTSDVTSWLDSVKSNQAMALSSSTNYEEVLVYNEPMTCDGKAKINASAVYSKLGTSNGYTYYLVQYNAESVILDNAWHTADITVSCDVDAKNAFQNLVDYGPDSTIGTISGSIGVDVGSTIGFSASWSYSIPEVQVHNQCDLSEDYFKIWHDTNESRSDVTTRAKPGMVVSVQQGSHYVAEDIFYVNYLKPYYDKLWPWDPTTEQKAFTHTVSAVINS